jgi:uncharacterized membrane protein affecting hemolysin expression
VNRYFSKVNLSQQLALIASGLCLTISLALVALAATSSRHVQLSQQESHGTSLAKQIARQVATSLESGDLLSVGASLQRFVATSSAEEVAIFDIEGTALGRAGEILGHSPQQYDAPVSIEGDVAGRVVITISVDHALAAHQRFVFTLLGLAILLSLAAYGAVRHLGQRLSDRILKMADSIALESGGTAIGDTPAGPPGAVNELDRLASNINALPMDLLRARTVGNSREENYQLTAVLYLQLNSLVDYVDTLDQHSLHRYTERLHQVVYGAAGFYGGQLQVVRQFGIAVYFSGAATAGSPAFRAASCAWLVRELSSELEKQLPLSMSIGMAISQSEMGVGDEVDIYPSLYLQHTLDELQAICASKPPNILLAPICCEDVDIAGRLEHRTTELQDYEMLVDFEGPYKDLLERQLRLIWKRLAELGSH